MKGNFKFPLWVVCGLIMAPFWAIAQEAIRPVDKHCGTTVFIEEAKKTINKNLQPAISAIAGLENRVYTSPDSPLLIIPVVVHIVHNDSDSVVGQGSNIAYQQVVDQITILNQDYRRMVGTRGFNTHPDGVDTRIEFRLAQRDPQGNPTDGVVRVPSGRNNSRPFNVFSDNYTLKANSFWPSNHYLNVWVSNIETYLGYAQFPLTNLIGVPSGVASDSITDGVVVSYQYFGLTGSLGSPYNLGRTLSHETGHYLGLLHLWGDVADCFTGSDFCGDTPEQEGFFYGCPIGRNTCPVQRTGPDMVANYLNYTDDRCMNIFTRCQSQRMRYVLRTATRRASLLNSPALLAIGEPIDRSLDRLVLYPNPSNSGVFTLKFPKDTESQEVITKVWDPTGRCILERPGTVTVPEYTVDLSRYPAGVYFLELVAGQRSRRFRMVKTGQ